MPATDLPYPAITICNKNGYDVGEYLRAVFDNFEYSCKDGDCEKSSLLRSHFPEYSSHKYIEASEHWIEICHVEILAVSLYDLKLHILDCYASTLPDEIPVLVKPQTMAQGGRIHQKKRVPPAVLHGP